MNSSFYTNNQNAVLIFFEILELNDVKTCTLLIINNNTNVHFMCTTTGRMSSTTTFNTSNNNVFTQTQMESLELN